MIRPSYWYRSGTLISCLLLLLSLGSGVAVLWSLDFQIEPFWMPLAVLVLSLALLLLRRFPAAFIPPMIFVGSLKTQPASGVLDVRDPTFWVLALVCGAILIKMLFIFVGAEPLTLSEAFAGQAKGSALFILLIGVVAVSYFYTTASSYGGDKALKFFIIGSLLYFSPLALIHEEKDLRHFTVMTLVLAMALLAKQVFFVAFLYSPAVADITSIGAGELFGMTILLLLTFKLVEGRFARLLLVFFIALLGAGMIISFSRGEIVSLLLMLGVGALLLKRTSGLISGKAATLGTLALVIACFILALLWIENVEPKHLAAKEDELATLSQGADPGGSAGERLHLFKAAFDGFLERPVFGWGVGAFSVYYYGTDRREYPHNLFLETAMEQGMLGIAILSAFLGTTFATLCRIVRATKGRFAFFLLIFGFHLTGSMVTGDLDSNRPLWLWCGMAFAAWHIVKFNTGNRPVLAQGFELKLRTCPQEPL